MRTWVLNQGLTTNAGSVWVEHRCLGLYVSIAEWLGLAKKGDSNQKVVQAARKRPARPWKAFPYPHKRMLVF